VVDAAVRGGVNLVQLREKDMAASRLLALAKRLRNLTKGRALLFINERIDVALACGADGVQLGEEALPLEADRRVSGSRLLLGRSVHSVESAATAEAAGADLLLLGTIFPTESHPGVAAGGLELLERVRRHVGLPFLAIGGVNADTVASVIGAGASGAAVITAITRSPEPDSAAREIMAEMAAAWPASTLEGTVRQARSC
jgi:thiamine-phosphate pyrophosphorylase